MVTKKQPQVTFDSRHIQKILAIACASLGLALAGCDSKFETTKAAQRDANEAARRAGSAGEARATDDLYSKVVSGAIEDTAAAKEKVKADSAQGRWKQYIVQQPADKDLQDALAKVSNALKSDLGKDVKASIEAEAGGVQLRLAQSQFSELQRDIGELMQQTSEVQQMANEAFLLGQEADGLANEGAQPKADDVNAAKSELQKAQGAVASAQANIKKLQDDIAARQAQAKQIYTQTDAAFDAADKLKGKAAIDAGNKAMKDRSDADDAVAKAAALQPELDQAQADLALAQVKQKEAEEKLDVATKSFELASARAKNVQDRITKLRDGAKAIVKDEGGVEAKYKKLLELAAGLDAKITAAGKTADLANASFTSAATDAGASQSELSTLVGERQLDSADPLLKLSKDNRLKALLTWSKAAALEQSGRAYVAGYAAAKAAGMTADAVAQAYKAAGISDAVAKPALVAKNYGDEATKKFKDAAAAAAAGNGMTGTDLDRLKWLGYGLEAVAQQGLSLATDNAGDKTAAISAARAAQSNAIKRNPEMATQLDPLLK